MFTIILIPLGYHISVQLYFICITGISIIVALFILFVETCFVSVVRIPVILGLNIRLLLQMDHPTESPASIAKKGGNMS